jgi:hypothetical protein
VPPDPTPSTAASEKPAPKPARQPAEIVRDIELERARLVDSVDALRAEAKATREKVLSPRVLGTVGGVIGGLILLKILRRRRH